MSLIDDPSLNPNHRVFDHTAEIASRAGLTREAAAHEMEKFLGVAEYETRKLVGQHTALRQPDAPAPEPRPHTEPEPENAGVKEQTVASEAQASPEKPLGKVQPLAPGQSAPTEA